MIKTYPELYKLDSKGNVRVWRMEAKGDKYRTIAGLRDGKQVTSTWKIATPKNVGKVNGTTGEEQAIAEVEAQYKKKLEREYSETLNDVGNLTYLKPMLAIKWEDTKDKIKYPVFIQPKLDGIRCIIDRYGAKSRSGKPIVAIPHILKALEPIFRDFPTAVFDGELYTHELKDDFNKIISLVRKTKPTEDDLIECMSIIEYHVYDIPSASDMRFQDRYDEYHNLIDGYNIDNFIKLVPTKFAACEIDVDEFHGTFLTLGYEGSIIRLNGEYENKRSNNLIKRKDFEDEEFEIIRIEEGKGNWSGYAKRVVFRNNDGREVGAGLKGTQSYARQVLLNADKYIGKKATIQFFTRTPDGIPRFPVAKALHKEDRW